jgi:hypothetical protein
VSYPLTWKYACQAGPRGASQLAYRLAGANGELVLEAVGVVGVSELAHPFGSGSEGDPVPGLAGAVPRNLLVRAVDGMSPRAAARASQPR